MLKYEIECGNLPVVIFYPEAGQTICTESGTMSWLQVKALLLTPAILPQ